MEAYMERIRDKIILCLFGLTCIIYHDTSIKAYTAILCCICISTLYEYYTHKKLLVTSSIGYFIYTVIYPPSIMLYPLIAYDLQGKENLVLFLTGTAFCILHVQDFEPYFLCLLVLFVMISMLFSSNTQKWFLLQQNYKKLRDSDRELELLLKARNHHLIQQQDYEIHVATLRERNRIAREIHDNVGHMLSRAILLTGAINAMSCEPVVKKQLDTLSETLDLAMNNIRCSVHDLHDESLDLKDSIDKILLHYSQYQIDFSYDISNKTTKEIKYCFLTIMKEALSNVTKHSNADQITITLREFTAFYQLLFHDNGTNYYKKNITGIGLENMKDRVHALNGHINIETTFGFKIFISVPKEKGDLI